MTLKNPAKIQILKKLKAEWLYTWGTELPPNLPPTTNFVPMIWGYWGQDNHIRQTGEAAQKAGIKELLGFNEPDQKQQSNISVEKALKKWPLLMETELRLGSPACVHPDREWMKQFMPAAKRKGLRETSSVFILMEELTAKSSSNEWKKFTAYLVNHSGSQNSQ